MYKSLIVKEVKKEHLEKLKSLNLNSIVLHFDHSLSEKISLVKEIVGDVEIEVIFDCFEGKNLQEKFPNSMMVEVENKEINEAGYYPVSPANSEVREFLLAELKKLSSLNIDTLWLNQVQFATKWWVSEPNILDTDYSDETLKLFEDYIGESIEGDNLEEKYLHIDGSYYHEWLMFKTGFINDFISEAKSILNPGKIKVGVFLIPWEETDYRAGIKRILGQDHGVIVDLADRVGLYMPYHSMEKDDEWVKAKLQYFWHLGKKFTSIVDVSTRSNHSSLDQILPLLQQNPSEGYIVDDFEKLSHISQLGLIR